LADIHANLPALEAVLALLDQRGISQILVLGDMVGYGPFPEECVALLRERQAICIRGNHDHFIAHHGIGKVPMSQSATQAANWTMARLHAETLEWLSELPLKIDFPNVLAVHGSPRDPTFINGYVYDMTYERNLEWMVKANIHTCFHGHSHFFGVYASDGVLSFPLCKDPHQTLSAYKHCLVNPGSIGQPRTGHPGADFAIFDPISTDIEFIHLHYNLLPILDRMREENFPDQLIERLENGR